MKRFLLILLFAPGALWAVSPVGMLPEDRVPIKVDENERNPFGRKAAKVESAAVENEESILRGMIEKLAVTGVVSGRTGRKVMLGSLTLEDGKVLPPLMANQSEKLKVNAVTEEKVEIGFVESDGTSGLRRIVIALSLSPQIQFKIHKPGPGAEKRAAGLDGVLTKDALEANQ